MRREALSALAILAAVSGITAAPASARPLSQRLLDAEQLPTVSGAWKASQPEVPEGSELAGTCHLVGLSAIGASRVAQRTFTAKATAEASHVVATFPDVKSARRGYAVLEAWQRSCPDAGQLKDVPGVTGGWYSVGSGAQGFVRRGRFIAVLRIESGKAEEVPIETALTRAAALL